MKKNLRSKDNLFIFLYLKIEKFIRILKCIKEIISYLCLFNCLIVNNNNYFSAFENMAKINWKCWTGK